MPDDASLSFQQSSPIPKTETPIDPELQMLAKALRDRYVMGEETESETKKFKSLSELAPSILAPLTPEEELRRGYEKALRLAGLTAQGFNNGLAQMLGLPGDVIQEILAGFGVSDPDRFAAGTETLEKLFSSGFGLREPSTIQANNTSERMFESGGEMVGFGTLPTMGAITKGRQLLQTQKVFDPASEQGGTVIKALRKLFMDMARQPGKTLRNETITAATAGSSGQLAAESFPEVPGSEFVGQIMGSLGPAGVVQSLKTTGRVFGNALKNIVPEPIRNLVPTRENIKRDIRERLTPAKNIPVEKRGAEIRRLQEDIPGFKPTTSQATGSPRIQRAEDIQRGSEKFNQDIRERLSDQNAVIHGAAEGLVPQAEIARVQTTLGKGLAVRQQALDNLVAQYQSFPEPHDIANKFRTSVQEVERRFKIIKDKKYDEVNNFNNAMLDVGAIRAKAQELMKKSSGGKKPEIGPEPPQVFRDVLDALASRTTLDEIRALRTRLLDNIREFSATPGAESKLRDVNSLLDVVENTLKGLESDLRLNLQYPDLVKKFKEANEYFSPRSKLLRSGIPLDTLGKRGGPDSGDFRVSAKLLAKRFLKNPEDLSKMLEAFSAVSRKKRPDDFTGIFADNELLNMVKGGIRSEFASSAIGPDGLNLIAARRFLRTHSAALDQTPDIKNEIKTLVLNSQNLKNFKTGSSAQSRQIFNEKQFEDLIDADPQHFFSVLIKQPAFAAQRVGKIVADIGGNPEAMMGFRSGFWKWALKRSESPITDLNGTAFLEPDSLAAVRGEFDAIFKKLYTPKQLKQMDSIIEAARLSFGTPFKGPIVTDIKAQELYSISNIISRAYAVERGVIGAQYVATEFLVKQLNKIFGKFSADEIRAMTDEALLNPDVAETLLNVWKNTERITTARLYAHLAQAGFDTVEELKGEDKHLVDKFRRQFQTQKPGRLEGVTESDLRSNTEVPPGGVQFVR